MFDSKEQADTGKLSSWLNRLAESLDHYLDFKHDDAQTNPEIWLEKLDHSLPENGEGMGALVDEIQHTLLPNASVVPNPGFSSFITTGAANAALLASLSASVASPQRYGLTAYNFLEERSLEWLVELFGLPHSFKGVYSSGGSVANIVALGAARQQAFEARGIDPARDGILFPCRIFASDACHHTIQRAAAVLGMGRNAVQLIPTDTQGKMCVAALKTALEAPFDGIQVAIIANAGTTDTGAIDPFQEIATIASAHKVWLHIDGAYGLPGVLDKRIQHKYLGVAEADSISVDPHKWLGAPVGIGATFVKDRSLLYRAFTQEPADYLEGACYEDKVQHSMDSLGIPYAEFGVELSAPCRGVVVWALLKEVGRLGITARIVRHNDMANCIAERVRKHPNLELALEPELSICCFRYISANIADLNQLNRQIHRQLLKNGNNMPSTTLINGHVVIRPCFIGARADSSLADALVNEVLHIGSTLEPNQKDS